MFVPRSFGSLRLECRVAWRRLTARPLSSLAVVVSLSLGLALVSLVVSVADRLLLRPLPAVADTGELIVIERSPTGSARGDGSLSWLDFEALHERVVASSSANSFPIRDVSAHYATSLGLSFDAPDAAEAPETLGLGTTRIDAVVHSDGYGDVLGVMPLRGRWPRDEPGGAAEVALGHGLWREFGVEVGATVRLQGKPVLVVGVTPPGFVGTDRVHRPEVWVSISTFEQLATGVEGQWVAKRGVETWLTIVARTRPGMRGPLGIGLLNEELSALRTDLELLRPSAWESWQLASMPVLHRAFGTAESRSELVRHLALLGLALACALAVAYGNAAGLLVMRAADRRAEWDLRLALGADRRGVLTAVSMEGLLVSIAAIVFAPFCVFLLLPLVRRVRLPEGAVVDMATDGTQILTLAALGLLGMIVLMSAPGFAASLSRSLNRRRVPSSSGSSARHLFLAAQIALTFVALGAAGQLIQTVRAYRHADSGISHEAASRLLAVGLDVGAAGHNGADALRTFASIDGALRAVKGVEGATLAATLPILNSGPMVDLTVDAEGADPEADGSPHTALHALVGAGFFSTVGREVLEGRDFDARDDATAAPVLIVNRTLATKLWNERSALGRQIRLVAATDPYTVVGVVADGRYAGLGAPAQPTLYMAHAQSERSIVAMSLATSATLLVRLAPTAGSHVVRDIRAAVAKVDPTVPVSSIQPLPVLIEGHFAIERQMSWVLVAVASALLLFCLLGIYSGLSHVLVHQRGELAIRSALGADGRRLLLRLANPTGRAMVLGVLAGLWLVPATRALLQGLLFGVAADSPGSWLAAVAVLFLAVVLAGAGPARQVLTLDPATVLRET